MSEPRKDFAMIPNDLDDAPDYADLELEHLGLIGCIHAYSSRHETDGFVPLRAVRSFGASGRGVELAEDLVARGELERAEGGYRRPAYLDVNPSHAEREADRQEARDRKARSRGKAAPTPSQNSSDPLHERPEESVTPPVTRDAPEPSRVTDTVTGSVTTGVTPHVTDAERTPSGSLLEVEKREETERGDRDQIPPHAGAGAREVGLGVEPPARRGGLGTSIGAETLTPKRRSIAAAIELSTGQKFELELVWEKFVARKKSDGAFSADWDEAWRFWLLDEAVIQKKNMAKGRGRRAPAPPQRDHGPPTYEQTTDDDLLAAVRAGKAAAAE